MILGMIKTSAFLCSKKVDSRVWFSDINVATRCAIKPRYISDQCFTGLLYCTFVCRERVPPWRVFGGGTGVRSVPSVRGGPVSIVRRVLGVIGVPLPDVGGVPVAWDDPDVLGVPGVRGGSGVRLSGRWSHAGCVFSPGRDLFSFVHSSRCLRHVASSSQSHLRRRHLWRHDTFQWRHLDAWHVIISLFYLFPQFSARCRPVF